MGFFSWKTQDTDVSIANQYSTRSTFHVDMIDDKGNVWSEDNYDGYGVFGGKDYYELLAEMNGLTGDGTEDLRMKGIDLAFKDSPNGDNPEVKFPNLVEMAEGWKYDPIGPESCEFQGFFYDDTDDEDEDEWDNTLMDGLEDEENDFNN
jgi:hypothetical protein